MDGTRCRCGGQRTALWSQFFTSTLCGFQILNSALKVFVQQTPLPDGPPCLPQNQQLFLRPCPVQVTARPLGTVVVVLHYQNLLARLVAKTFNLRTQEMEEGRQSQLGREREKGKPGFSSLFTRREGSRHNVPQACKYLTTP